MKLDELAGAARYLDGNKTAEEVMELLGVDPQAVVYLAKQRALRGILALRGQTLIGNGLQKIELNETEQRMENLLTAASMDGLMIGLAAAKGLYQPYDEGNHRRPSVN